jgi:hypothetical protein
MTSRWLGDYAVVLGTAAGVVLYCSALALAVVGLLALLHPAVLGPVCSDGLHCIAQYVVVGWVLFGLGLWPLARLYDGGYLELPDAW